MNKARRAAATATTITTGVNEGKVYSSKPAEMVSLGILASTELYDPATTTFASPSQTAAMNIGRSLPTASIIATGPGRLERFCLREATGF